MTEGTDVALRLPVLRDLTYNEAHSALLGLVGVFVGVGYRLGYTDVVAGFAVVVLCAAFGLRRMSGDTVPVAQRVIRREPWYFLAVFVASSVGTALAYPAVAA